MELTMCCPTLFGLEGIVADELRFGGKLTDVRAENGRVFFEGDESTLAWANLNLRCAERVLIRLGAFRAKTFDQLFEGVKALPWEEFIPADGAFPVKGHSLDSALHSIPDCQKIVKKAVVSRLSQKYGQGWFEESGAKYQIQFAIMHDTAEIYLDTSGAGLHKRGYRANSNAAPLRETLAAAMVKLARWRGREPFLDPFCGSGTIAIEAAMIAQRRAPGLLRRFDAEKWSCFDKKVWQQAREDALCMAGMRPPVLILSAATSTRNASSCLSRMPTRQASQARYSSSRRTRRSAITAAAVSCSPIRPTVSGCSTNSRQSSFIRRSAVRRKIRR